MVFPLVGGFGNVMGVKSKNITRVERLVDLEDRWDRFGHKSGVLWFTGLPGSGKSTLVSRFEKVLFEMEYQVAALDGWEARTGLSADVDYSREGRGENIRRVGELAALYADAGFIVLAAFLSPYRADRDRARKASGEYFHEIHLDPGIEVCEARDPDGLYALARAGEIEGFTGVDAPYEAPENPELRLDTGALTIAETLSVLTEYVDHRFRLD